MACLRLERANAVAIRESQPSDSQCYVRCTSLNSAGGSVDARISSAGRNVGDSVRGLGVNQLLPLAVLHAKRPRSMRYMQCARPSTVSISERDV